MADDFLVGPFEEWRVVVEGRSIPLLTGRRHDDGRLSLVLDRRFSVELPDEELARDVAWIVAQALAIGQGYPHLGATTKERPFAPISSKIETKPNLHIVQTEGA